MLSWRPRSAIRAERLAERTAEYVAAASTSVPPAVASDEIAPTLGVSPHTLRTHLQNVLTKLKVHSKLDAVVLAIRHGKIVANLAAAQGDDSEEGFSGAEVVDVAALETEREVERGSNGARSGPMGRAAGSGRPGRG